MFAQTYGCTTLGLDGVLVTVEVDISNGIPGLDIVGLPDPAVRESRERVRAAIKNAGLDFPNRRITVNLAPADLKKDSSGLDLPIAMGILAASGQITAAACLNKIFIGELSLEGKIRGISGVLSMAVHGAEQSIAEIYVAPENAQEALLAGKIKVYAVSSLNQIIEHLKGTITLQQEYKIDASQITNSCYEDFADVQGQVVAKRALEIAAAGGHNVLILGYKTKPLEPLVNTGAVA